MGRVVLNRFLGPATPGQHCPQAAVAKREVRIDLDRSLQFGDRFGVVTLQHQHHAEDPMTLLARLI